MTETEKAKQLVETVRNMENEHFKKAGFCREHNMKLDQMKHEEIAQVLREVAFKIYDKFELHTKS